MISANMFAIFAFLLDKESLDGLRKPAITHFALIKFKLQSFLCILIAISL